VKYWHLWERNSTIQSKFKIYFFKNWGMFGGKYKRNEWFQHPVCLQANMRLSITFCTQKKSDTNNSRCKIFWYGLCCFLDTLLEYLKTQVQAWAPHSYKMLQNLSAVLSMDWHIFSILEREGGDFYYEFSNSGSFISNASGFSWLVGHQLPP
jgi:hypothetical protein